jgi:hypothetical protein
MSERSIIEKGAELRVSTYQRHTMGIAYWQSRAEFSIADGHARMHVTSMTAHASPEDAEKSVLELARECGWGQQ